jgi:NADPH:quinone reductase-like Zn-dependent oxidoreductase
VDIAFDAAGDEALRASLELVQNKKRIGTIVAFSLAEELGVRQIRSHRTVGRLAELVELYSHGKLKVHIRKAFPLQRAADAHREIESGHGRGKVVLTMG